MIKSTRSMRLVNSMTKEEQLRFLEGNLGYLFDVNIVYTELSKKYSRRLGPQLSKILISSLGRNFLLGLAALTDPLENSRGNKNASIFLLEEFNLTPHKSTVSKIRNFRRKLIAHNDQEGMHPSSNLIEESNLTHEETDKLLDCMINAVEKAVGKISPSRDEAKNYYTEALERLFRTESLG